MTLIAGTIHSFLRYIKYSRYDFNPYLFMLSSAFDHSHGIPNLLQTYLQVKLVLGLWLLVAVIFTHAYKGIAIMEIISPIARESATHFDNLTEPIITTSNGVSLTSYKTHVASPNTFKILPNIVWKEFTSLSDQYELDSGYTESIYTFRDVLIHLKRSIIDFMKTKIKLY